MAHDFDAVVIGSGFGGAVAACRLAEAGYRVLILERGRRWARENYPSVSDGDWIWDSAHPERSNGWLDFRFFGTIATIAGAGVGGGSLHYANVSLNAMEDLFQAGWPPEITFQDLESTYYPRVSQMLQPQKIPANQFSNRTKLLKESAELAGFGDQYTEVPLAIRFDENYAYDAWKAPNADDSVLTPNAEGIDQGFCVHLGKCVLGCPVEARNTLALNYIPRAERHGAEVRPLHVVRSIEPSNGGYRVHFDQIVNRKLNKGSVTGRIVVVSAGSVGSTELLLRCRDQHKTLPQLSPRLGEKWSTNANYLSLAIHPQRDVYPSRGPTISAAIKFLGDNDYKGSRFVIEDGGVPDLLEDYLDNLKNPSGDARQFQLALKTIYDLLNNEPLRNLMPWFAQGRDEPIGTFSLKRWFLGLFGEKRKLHLSWDRDGARDVLDAIQEVHRTLAEKTDRKLIVQLRDALITPHPLGGCSLGQTADDGVVDHRGAAFGYENLYVADGAIIPRPIGHNPSKTIAALSERIAEQIVDEGR